MRTVGALTSVSLFLLKFREAIFKRENAENRETGNNGQRGFFKTGNTGKSLKQGISGNL